MHAVNAYSLVGVSSLSLMGWNKAKFSIKIAIAILFM